MSRYLICPGNLENVFSWLVYGDTSEEHLKQSLIILVKSWRFVYNFAFTMATMFDISLQSDLIFTNLKPFQKPSKRVGIKVPIAIFLSTIITTIQLVTDFDYGSTLNFGIFLTLKFTFYTCALTNLAFSTYVFTQRGLSLPYRRLLIKRHLSYCILTSFCQTVAFLQILHQT